MQSHGRSRLWITVVAAAVLIGIRPAGAQTRYAVEDLGSLGGTESWANDVNDNGQVAGSYKTAAGELRGFKWANGTYTPLPTLGGKETEALSIANDGICVGYSRNGSGVQKPVRWSEATFTNLAPNDGDTGIAYGVRRTNSDDIVGNVGNTAMFWYKITELHPLPFAVATDVQLIPTAAHAVIVGYDSGFTAYRWSSAGTARLQFQATMTRINATEATTGQLLNPKQAIFVLRDQTPKLLGTLGGAQSFGLAITDANQVVGWAETLSGARHAFLWTATDGMIDLNSRIDKLFGWELLEARGINNNGQIVGKGRIGGQIRAFRLTPLSSQPLAIHTQIAVLRPSTHEWFLAGTNGPPVDVQFGGPDDIPVPADYFGTGHAQIAVFRKTTKEWFIRTDDGGVIQTQWGGLDDVPVPGDYLGIGRAQIAVYRPSKGQWFIRRDDGSPLIVNWGTIGDVPVPAPFAPYFGMSLPPP